jgi:hypothetical protein
MKRKKMDTSTAANKPSPQPPPLHQSDGESEWSEYESAHEESEVNIALPPEITKDAAIQGQTMSRSTKRRRRRVPPALPQGLTKRSQWSQSTLSKCFSRSPQEAIKKPRVSSSTPFSASPVPPRDSRRDSTPDLTQNDNELIKMVKDIAESAENYHQTVCGPNVHPDWACRKIIETKKDLATKLILLHHENLDRIRSQVTPYLAVFNNPNPLEILQATTKIKNNSDDSNNYNFGNNGQLNSKPPITPLQCPTPIPSHPGHEHCESYFKACLEEMEEMRERHFEDCWPNTHTENRCPLIRENKEDIRYQFMRTDFETCLGPRLLPLLITPEE